MTSAAELCKAPVATCKTGFKKGSKAVRTKIEIISEIFSTNDSKPGIFSIVISIFFINESLNVKIFQSDECNSWGLIASGLFPPPVALSRILSIESKSRLISFSAPPGSGIEDKSPLRTAEELLEPGPPRDDWAADLACAFFNSAFKSETDASLK
jgi:hypothetical protein